MSLANRNVVVVGALGAICYEACKALMKQKPASFFALDVIENDGAVKALQALNKDTKVVYIKFDILNKDVIKKTIADIVSQVQYIDVLLNGAGILADPHVERTMGVNLIGLINTTIEALPYMDVQRKGRGGTIVNIASVLGLEPCPPCAIYSASKFGVIGFTRSIADPYYFDKTGVAVIAFCPGLTETPLKNELGNHVTFEYSKEIGVKMNSSKTQTPADCGQHLAEVIVNGKNNTIYISDQRVLKTVEPKKYWEPTF